MSIEQTIDDEMNRGFCRYTVSSENLERVIGLATDDILSAIRPQIAGRVRDKYEEFVRVFSRRG